MGGRREVSIIFYRPVTRSDLKRERSFFRGSVSSFLQLVVASWYRWSAIDCMRQMPLFIHIKFVIIIQRIQVSVAYPAQLGGFGWTRKVIKAGESRKTARRFGREQRETYFSRGFTARTRACCALPTKPPCYAGYRLPVSLEHSFDTPTSGL